MKLFSDEQVLKIWWYLVGLMVGYKIDIIHGNFALFFFFFFLSAAQALNCQFVSFLLKAGM
jgi:hypothetical protein